MPLEVPLPWEHLLWSGQSARPGRRRIEYALTDFRLVRVSPDDEAEVAVQDITEVECRRSRLDRCLGAHTVIVRTRRDAAAMVLPALRQGVQVAALLEILASESSGAPDHEALRAILNWDPRSRPRGRFAETAISLAVVAVAIVAVTHVLPARVAAAAPDGPMTVSGHKRPRAEIVAFMEQQVMPWAREALGPLKGGPERINCQTCHGADAVARDWAMPAVAALPQPDLRDQGWERYGAVVDAQVRNAIYGYLADSGKQSRAGYMREVVMPGMAGLLQRPPYDFTQPYAYNRVHAAFGCYHCHRVN